MSEPKIVNGGDPVEAQQIPAFQLATAKAVSLVLVSALTGKPVDIKEVHGDMARIMGRAEGEKLMPKDVVDIINGAADAVSNFIAQVVPPQHHLEAGMSTGGRILNAVLQVSDVIHGEGAAFKEAADGSSPVGQKGADPLAFLAEAASKTKEG